jgi:hypothetical protein
MKQDENEQSYKKRPMPAVGKKLNEKSWLNRSFVKILRYLLCIALATSIFGCSSARVRVAPSSFSVIDLFHEQEVLTRQWRGLDGQMMTLLGYQIVKTNGYPTIAIAKYGDKRSNQVFCVDIYQRRQSSISKDPILILVCHDSADSKDCCLDSLKIAYQGKRMFFDFVRDDISPDTGKKTVHSYSYSYDEKTGCSRMMSEFYPAP